MLCRGWRNKQGVFTIYVYKRKSKNAAEYKVLVSDDSKFNKKSFCKICDLADFNLVIVNDNIDKNLKNNLEESGVTLKLV